MSSRQPPSSQRTLESPSAMASSAKRRGDRLEDGAAALAGDPDPRLVDAVEVDQVPARL